MTKGRRKMIDLFIQYYCIPRYQQEREDARKKGLPLSELAANDNAHCETSLTPGGVDDRPAIKNIERS